MALRRSLQAPPIPQCPDTTTCPSSARTVLQIQGGAHDGAFAQTVFQVVANGILYAGLRGWVPWVRFDVANVLKCLGNAWVNTTEGELWEQVLSICTNPFPTRQDPVRIHTRMPFNPTLQPFQRQHVLHSSDPTLQSSDIHVTLIRPHVTLIRPHVTIIRPHVTIIRPHVTIIRHSSLSLSAQISLSGSRVVPPQGTVLHVHM
jgi:hypothetical protein